MTPQSSVIHSMTGFGAGSAESSGLLARVEVRAVNHRGLKLNVRSRPGLGAVERDLRNHVRDALKRGAVDVYVTVVRPVDPEHLPVREDVARATVAALRHLGAELKLEGELQVGDLVSIPGLFDTSGEEVVDKSEWPVVEQALEQALAQVLEMRQAEGAATAACLEELVKPLAAFAAASRKTAPAVVQRAHDRLHNRLEELRGTGLDTGDRQALEREVCLFADRADINEELDRLESHLAQYGDLLRTGGEIGKRLEFLAQEFLREVNTCASKANDTAIVSQAIDAKLAVEKIKEQAANIE